MWPPAAFPARARQFKLASMMHVPTARPACWAVRCGAWRLRPARLKLHAPASIGMSVDQPARACSLLVWSAPAAGAASAAGAVCAR